VVTETKIFQTPNLVPLDSCLWIWMQREVYSWKIINRDKFPARIVYAASRKEIRNDQLRKKDVIFAHESQSALMLAVRFSNIYCKAQQNF